MITSPRALTLMRTVGQLGLLLYAAHGLDRQIVIASWCGGDTGKCSFFASTPTNLLALSLAAVAVAGWWATCRPTRARWARLCVGVVIGWLAGFTGCNVAFAVDSPNPAQAAGLLADALIAIGPLALLALSYLGRPRLELVEVRPAPWIAVLLALAGVEHALLLAQAQLFAGAGIPSLILIEMTAAGLLYGALRRRWPLAGAASWLPVTAILTALTLPHYAMLQFADHNGSTRWSLPLWLAAMALTVALAAAHWSKAHRNRHPPACEAGDQAPEHTQ